MLLCSSKLPVNEYLTAEIFVDLAIDWIMQSYNYKFDELSWDGSQEYTKHGQRGEVFQVELFDIFRKFSSFRCTDCYIFRNRSIIGHKYFKMISTDINWLPRVPEPWA